MPGNLTEGAPWQLDTDGRQPVRAAIVSVELARSPVLTIAALTNQHALLFQGVMVPVNGVGHLVAGLQTAGLTL